MSEERKSDWKTEYEDWRRSGKTQAEYCKSKGLNVTSFKNGVFRMRQTSGKRVWEKRGQSSPFVSIQIPEVEAPYCEIRFGGGSRITIDKPEAVMELGMLIRSLKNA